MDFVLPNHRSDDMDHRLHCAHPDPEEEGLMGVYPDEVFKFQDNGTVLVRTYDDYSGLVLIDVFQLVARITDRTTCYCCSCGDRPGSDPYCRNHGFAGARPCLDHDVPGQANEDGNMPDSVQAKRDKNANISSS